MRNLNSISRDHRVILVVFILANVLCLVVPVAAPVIVAAEVTYGVRLLRSRQVVGSARILAVTAIVSGISVLVMMGTVLLLSLGGTTELTIQAGTPYVPTQIGLEATEEVRN